MAGKDVDEGDKIFLPPSALDRLARMNVEYPMLFEITNTMIGKKTNCGVLEFSAEEGWCYMPFGMMQNLAVSEHLRAGHQVYHSYLPVNTYRSMKVV
jgi:ubiquitin fusion degradation protein 1